MNEDNDEDNAQLILDKHNLLISNYELAVLLQTTKLETQEEKLELADMIHKTKTRLETAEKLTRFTKFTAIGSIILFTIALVKITYTCA